MGFADFIDRVTRKRTEDITARAERAGKEGVKVARSICPVRTGHLRDSIGYGYDQSSMVLTLYADAHYAAEVARRSPFMKAGRAAMSRIFTGGTSEIQFATLPEKYHQKARLLTAGTGHTIIGHRSVRKTR